MLALKEHTSVMAGDITSPTALPCCAAVLIVERLPRTQRAEIEALMVEHLVSEPVGCLPGTDALSADWFTRWEHDPSAREFYAVRCRQVVTGTREELEHLECALQALQASNSELGTRAGLKRAS
ncbi:hypothetical protein [Corynebacterium tapiri]|uniref:Uncharacterized protein n=1 Tax=Corynebacterium tapiri TaxID=1448266 RepID=A0A5C4U5U4_9CORY|nr:hypothetical protein [Corynebacterium tapiri]TNL98756.1 hypothetical protein FHE74_03810 [Corynebacterium tapiri]